MRDINTFRRTTKALAIASFLVLMSFASAGTFSLTALGWSNFNGTASTDETLYKTESDKTGGSIKLSALIPNNSFNLAATWRFDIIWTPSGTNDIAPSSAVVTFSRLSTLNVAGNGMARIVRISDNVILDEINSSDLELSGYSTQLEDLVLTLPLIQQPDGTYKASGSIRSDRLRVSWNSNTPDVTTCEETFNLDDIKGGS